MKILNSFEFSNNKRIEVRYYTVSELKKRKLPECDRIALAWKNGDEGYTLLFMRPDEIAICLALLGDGLYKTIKAYKIGISKNKQFNYEIR